MRSTLPYMPKFRPEERELLKKNKPDAFGLNHYGTSFVAYDEGNPVLEQWDQWACAACGPSVHSTFETLHFYSS